MERLIQFNLSRESIPQHLQWPVNSFASSPDTPPEIELHSETIAPLDLMEMSPCEREDRERMFGMS
jgi:hypothetical protein